MLEAYYVEDQSWKNFCDSLDRRLQPFEEIKAVWMILGVVFVLLILALIAGVICRFILVDDEELGLILTGVIFAAIFLIFSAYFFLMQGLVVKPLDAMGEDITQFCEEMSSQWEGVEFLFERSGKCSVYWDADFDAWINVTLESKKPIDARGTL